MIKIGVSFFQHSPVELSFRCRSSNKQLSAKSC